ncbi:MAG: BMP family ABC transporter substrate-binding protein [Acidimicrobiia bacterium]|nr:MAG: BMP family ABC transporter substrate-binding protein [Acidimicrobiia bacterium]
MRPLVLVMVLALVAVACGDDDAGTTTTAAEETTTTAGEETTTTAGEETTTTAAADPLVADFNGDGKVVIGVATDGPRDDGAYYQALVDKITEISTDQGFEAPIVVDMIEAANAAQELRNIAEQGADIIAVGSGALAEGLPEVVADFPEVFWYCNCGSGYPATEGMLISHDRGAELWLSGGYAAGLLLQERGGTEAVFIGCCDLDFEKESFAAFELGLSLVDESYTAVYVATGAFPYDFNNTAAATEAYQNAKAEGAMVIVPFLGGAHEPVVQLANTDGLVVMTAGSSKGCERDDLAYDFEVKFDTGDYVQPIFDDIFAGTAEEGGIRTFTVGIDDEVGAEFCDATAEQVAALDDFNARIGAGEFEDAIYQILADAYGF